MDKGYSLIELMVVLTVFAILMLVATQSLLLSLRGANKSESISRVKENVELAVSVMERKIRNAKSVNPCNDFEPLVLNYIDQQGVNSEFACVNPGADGYISDSGSRLTNQQVSIMSCSLTCTPNIGAPPSVEIAIVAQDKFNQVGIEGARAESTTTILLRQY